MNIHVPRTAALRSMPLRHRALVVAVPWVLFVAPIFIASLEPSTHRLHHGAFSFFLHHQPSRKFYSYNLEPPSDVAFSSKASSQCRALPSCVTLTGSIASDAGELSYGDLSLRRGISHLRINKWGPESWFAL